MRCAVSSILYINSLIICLATISARVDRVSVEQ